MKILMIGDLHFGERGNSQKFNEQILTFIEAMCEKYKGKVDKVVQMGDYYHHRNKIQVDTLSYGITAAKKLATTFGKDNVYVLAGNHCLFYLNRLDVSSLAAIDPYVTVVDDLLTLDTNVLLTPWIASDEQWERVVDGSESHDYILGHFEFAAFKMNENYVMEHGRSHKELHRSKRIISGHYHTIQETDNVTYTGTPYPITFSEANQSHGVFILDTETNDLEYDEYETIKVISIPYDQIDTLVDYDSHNTSVRIEFPTDIEDESIISEMVTKVSEMGFEGVKTQYKGKKLSKIMESSVDIVDAEDIDTTIIHSMSQIDVDGIDQDMLVSLYKQAIEVSHE